MANHRSPKPGLPVRVGAGPPDRQGVVAGCFMKSKIKDYLKETYAEIKKVVWPDRRYVAVATLIILVLVFLTGFFVMLSDFGLAEILKLFLR